MRDLPAPRRTEGAIGSFLGRLFAWPYRGALAGLSRTGIRPWHLTFLSLLVNIVAGWLLVTGRRFLPGMLLIPAGLLDVFDGGLARLRGEASSAGAFLDSVVDRVSDVAVFGSIYWSEAGQGREVSAALALSGLIVSLLVSHVRAEGEALGLSLSEGIVQRLERYVALLLGLIVPGTLPYVLGLLTALGTFTVLQRITSAWVQLPRVDRKKSDKNGTTI